MGGNSPTSSPWHNPHMETNLTNLFDEVIRTRLAVTAFVRPLLIWVTFQIFAGVFIGIGLIIFLADPAGFSEGGFVPVIIGSLINLVGLIVAVSSGWSHLKMSTQKIRPDAQDLRNYPSSSSRSNSQSEKSSAAESSNGRASKGPKSECRCSFLGRLSDGFRALCVQ